MTIELLRELVKLGQMGATGEAAIRADHMQHYQLARVASRIWRLQQALSREGVRAEAQAERKADQERYVGLLISHVGMALAKQWFAEIGVEV